ncbi:MAG: pre-peptidase C-terminal domain-containing protein, partial [Bacteroidia bacterium]
MKSFLVFLFFIFTTTSFSQGNTCATAESLTINGTCDTGTSLTQTINTTICGATAWRRIGYYSFTVSGGPLNIVITGQSGNRNMVLGLFSGSCGSLTNIQCVDGNTTNGAQTETITANNLANGTYYIAVGNTTNNDMNLTSICVTTSCSGTPTAGTTSVSPTSGAPASSYTVSNTGHATGSGITYQWQYSTNGGGAWTNQGTATSTYSNYTATAPASGTVIWRLVVTCTASGQSSNSTTATFTVNSTTNFTCATARNLPCGTTNLAGTTVGSSNTAHGTGCSISNYGAWYTFVGDGQLTTISSTAGAGYDHELSISSGSCGTFTNLACQDSGLSGGTESYSFTATAGVTYYVYVAHYSSGNTTTGTFTISRTCTAPITNDNCAGAISVPVNPTRTCTSTVAGSILGATDSGVTASGCGGTDDDDVWYSFVATSTTHHIE